MARKERLRGNIIAEFQQISIEGIEDITKGRNQNLKFKLMFKKYYMKIFINKAKSFKYGESCMK